MCTALNNKILNNQKILPYYIIMITIIIAATVPRTGPSCLNRGITEHLHNQDLCLKAAEIETQLLKHTF